MIAQIESSGYIHDTLANSEMSSRLEDRMRKLGMTQKHRRTIRDNLLAVVNIHNINLCARTYGVRAMASSDVYIRKGVGHGC